MLNFPFEEVIDICLTRRWRIQIHNRPSMRMSWAQNNITEVTSRLGKVKDIWTSSFAFLKATKLIGRSEILYSLRITAYILKLKRTPLAMSIASGHPTRIGSQNKKQVLLDGVWQKKKKRTQHSQLWWCLVAGTERGPKQMLVESERKRRVHWTLPIFKEGSIQYQWSFKSKKKKRKGKEYPGLIYIP